MSDARLIELPGPVPVTAGAFDLTELGYVEQEFRLDGTAQAYQLTGDRGPDGQWPVQADQRAPFATRLLLRQPADPASFSGTVLVEWLNVSGGLDAAPDWMLAHTDVLRQGHAWAGVSAQRAGIEGGGMVDGLHLKVSNPLRYADLSHPGDRWAFDIFSQAGRAIRAQGGLPARGGNGKTLRLLASGHSQSGAFLVTYVNAIDWLAAAYDGFLVHGRPGVGASLDTGFSPAGVADGGERIRSDLRVPVIVLQTETDVALLGSGRATQPDGELLRNWELAGAAHADTYLLFASGQDDGQLPADKLAQLLRPTTDILMGSTQSPVNSGPQHHYVECAAVEQLTAWVRGESKPPSAPRLNLTAEGRDFVRDELGIATGGIRTPWTDVPASVLSGTGQRGELFAFLFGTTAELSAAELGRLYPGGQRDYLAKFGSSLDTAVAAGFLLAEDRAEILALAAAGWVS